jgi:hypothetical protein
MSVQSSALYVALTKRDPPVSLDVSSLFTNPQQRVYLHLFSFLKERKRKREKRKKREKNKGEKQERKEKTKTIRTRTRFQSLLLRERTGMNAG